MRILHFCTQSWQQELCVCCSEQSIVNSQLSVFTTLFPFIIINHHRNYNFSLRDFILTCKLVEKMAYGLMGVFHHGLKWTAALCLHRNRGSGLKLDNAAGFSTCSKNPTL